MSIATPVPVLFVSGLARCGTSLTMQMLSAAGIPCAGDFPGFEVDAVNHRDISPAFMVAHRGQAVKWLNPHLTSPGVDPVFFVTLWLDRNPVEQARSQAKFVHLLMGAPYPDRRHLRRWASGLRRDRAIALGFIGIFGWPKLMLDFEALVGKPRETAARIAAWLEPWFGPLDVDRMAAAVRPRESRCEPGLAIEAALMAQRPETRCRNCGSPRPADAPVKDAFAVMVAVERQNLASAAAPPPLVPE